MNARFAAAALVASTGLAAPALAQTPAIPMVPVVNKIDGCGKSSALRAFAESGLSPVGGSTFPLALAAQSVLSDTDVTHVNLAIEVDFNTTSLAGTCTTSITSTINGLAQYTFRLSNNFNVSSIKIDGVPAAWTTDSATTKTVTLPVVKNIGDPFVIEVIYDGPTVSGFFGSIEWATPANPHPWFSENMVYTLSQPYYSYTWWPSEDADVGQPGDYTDKFTLDMSITAPSKYTTAGLGTLVSIDALPGNRSRYNFSHSYEIPNYLVAFATSEYNKYSQTWNYGNVSMPVEIMFTLSNDSPTARNNWFRVLPMLTKFSDSWGLYPFSTEKYGIYEFGFGGGMEHQTNTGQLGHPCCTGLEWLHAHELAHQWFGDWVTCATWHDIWLNEGFATYGEALWKEATGGESAMLNYMNINDFPASVNGTVYVYDTTNPNTIFDTDTVYLKAGWTVLMLRHKLGLPAFNQALQDYIAWYGGSGATTLNFRDAVEASSGVNIHRFIDQWIFQTGAPRYVYSWRNDTVNGQEYLRMRVRQTQPGTDAGGAPFEMGIDVRVNGADNYLIQNDAYDEYFVIPLTASAGSVAIDPDSWILKRGPSVREPYNDGPPVVIANSATDLNATVTFVERVITNPGDFSVVTNDINATPIPFTMTYNTGTNTATLDFGSTLPNGSYRVTVLDTLTSFAAGIALDGEGATLPSGDGLAGGNHTFTFTVNNPCAADLNGDGILDNGDIGAFVTLFLAGDPAVDFNGDGILDNGDIGAFVMLFLAGC